MALDATLMGYVQRALDASKAAAGAEQAEQAYEDAMLRARSEKLSRKKPAWHTRVYIPDGDEHINEPRSRGRPYTSLHHLIHISDVAAIPRRPKTKLGRFRYGSPIKESPEKAKKTNESPARAPGAAAEGDERRR